MHAEAEPRPRRRFTLLDAMVLVAAIAPGLALARIVVDERDDSVVADHPVRTAWNATALGVAVATPVALTLTPALLLLRLRHPRPQRARLWHSRGALTLVSLSIVAPIAGILLFVLLTITAPFNPFDPEIVVYTLLLLPMTLAPTAAAVAVCCRLLGVRARRPEWPDRLGRAWGWPWVVAAPIDFWYVLQ